MEFFWTIYIVILGFCIGSFINVVIYRFPKGKSLLYPRSFCPKCESKIEWFDNIPILSYLFLNGKCRKCKTKISLIYPLNEILFAFLLSLFFAYTQRTLIEIIVFCFFGSFLYSISIIDIKTLKIPNKLNLYFYFFGFISGLVSILSNNFTLKYFILNHFLSSIIIYIFFEFLRSLIRFCMKKNGFGGGDSKLISVLTLWLGYKTALITTLLSIYIGGTFVLFGMIFKQIKRQDKIPFGPFLCFAAYLLSLIGSDKVINIFKAIYI